MNDTDHAEIKTPLPPAYRVLVSAGDPSGDLHASRVVAEVKRRRADVHFFGLGGPRMAEAGALITHDNRGCSAIGVFEGLKVAPRLLRTLADLRQGLHTMPPDLVILVDFGAFNMRLASAAREVEVPVFYYIPPGSWCKEMREVTRRVAQICAKVATPFAWSAELIGEAGGDARFVGHPLLDGLAAAPPPEEARRRLELRDREQGLALLPGSRPHEIRYILPLLLRAAELARRARTELAPLVSCAPGAPRQDIERIVQRYLPDARMVTQTYDLLRGSAVGLVKSGTATLEAALLGLPVVVTYAGSAFSAIQWRLFAKRNVRFIALPNILADELIVPELYGREGTPERLADEAVAIYTDAARRAAITEAYRRIHKQLGDPGASARVADMIEEMLETESRPALDHA